MKVIPLSEAKANLGRYDCLCQIEPVILTSNGVPSSRLAHLEEDADRVENDRLHG